jgi:Transposase domain (DUF772)
VDLRTEFGTLYEDQLFADLYSPQGRPMEVAPWRLALVMVVQYIEGLTDRQAAEEARRCKDWEYALSLGLTDPGFDFTLLHDFRQRLQLQGKPQAEIVLATWREERTSGIIRIKEVRQSGGRGLSGMMAIAPRLVVREERNRHLSSLTKKGGGNLAE